MSETISLQEPASRIEWEECGGMVIYGDCERWLVPLAEDEQGDWIDLRWLSGNPWSAAHRLGIPAEELKALRDSARYECPLALGEYHAIVPVAAIARPGSDLVDRALKQEWLRDAARDVGGRREAEHLGRVESVLLGTGYTVGTLPDDGGADIELFGVPLSSGDLLVVAAMVWFNK